ncbi:MAG: hypothetical protein ABJB03_10455 [Rhodoglobus sp.]
MSSPRVQTLTGMEHRWPVLVATAAAVLLYSLLPDGVQVIPRWVLPALAIALSIPLVIFNPHRLNRETRWSRYLSIAIAIVLTVVNQVTLVLTLRLLVSGEVKGPDVLLTTLQVWVTNVIAFALVFWELDRGGPVARRTADLRDDAPMDFRFPQEDGAPGNKGWKPAFVDYAYFSLSNMMAFSPTDVMPMTARAKILMGYQATTGFILLALVISRAVNILT